MKTKKKPTQQTSTCENKRSGKKVLLQFVECLEDDEHSNNAKITVGHKVNLVLQKTSSQPKRMGQ